MVTRVLSVKLELATDQPWPESYDERRHHAPARCGAKSDDGDFVKAIAETVLQRIMDADVDNIIGAARHERSPERLTYRNGYRERTLETRLGSLELKVPKLRAGPS